MATTTTSTKSRQSTRRSSSTSRQTSRARSQPATSSGGQTTRSTGTTSTSTRPSGTKSTSGTTVNLPFVTANFHAPDMHLPSRQEVSSAASSAAETVRSQLPSPGQAAFYGALGLGAAFAVIEWPVALAIGVGNALVQRQMQGREKSESSSSS